MEHNIALFMLIVAVVIFVTLLLFSMRVKYSQRHDQTPEIGDIHKLYEEEDILMDDQNEQQISSYEKVPVVKSIAEVESTTIKKEPRGSDLIVIYILAKPNEFFQGYELLQSLLAAQVQFGKMSIFHRYLEENSEKILFSLAKATEPGIFDINSIGSCRCSGLSLFMQISDPMYDLTALRLMLATAEQLAEDLNGRLVDENHKALTAEKIQDYEDKILKSY